MVDLCSGRHLATDWRVQNDWERTILLQNQKENITVLPGLRGDSHLVDFHLCSGRYLASDWSVFTLYSHIGESDAARIFDSIGQGSFGAALASSLNVGAKIYDATKANH